MAEQSTELSVPSQSRDATVMLALAANPDRCVDMIEKLGSKIGFGMKCGPGNGAAVMLQMLGEGLLPAQYESKYHNYEGGGFGLSAEWIHAEMRRRGWRVEWIADGEDGKRASVKLSKGNEEHIVEFTIEMAHAKRLGNSNGKDFMPGKNGGISAWKKDAPQMLRSKLWDRAATMYEPGIGAGMTEDGEAVAQVIEYVPDDAVDAEYVVEKPRTDEPKPATQSKIQPVDTDQVESELLGNKTPPETEKNQPREVTLDSRASAIDFPQRAFTAFAQDPPIITLRDLVQYTREQLKSRGGLGDGTLDKIEKLLAEHKFGLAPTPEENQPSEGETESSEASTDDTPPDAASDAAAGSISKAQRGEAIAEIMQLCSADGELKKRLVKTMADEFKKNALADCNDVQVLIALACLLAIKAGVADDRIKTAVSNVLTDPDPIARVQGNIENLRARLGN